jgi:hypothetical protein
MRLRYTVLAIMALLWMGSRTRLAAQYNDHDRQAAHDYVAQHHDNLPAGLRDADRKPEYEDKLKVGVVLAPEVQREVHPLPRDLAHNLSKPPAGCKNVVVGGHVVQVDKSHQVKDVIHLEN